MPSRFRACVLLIFICTLYAVGWWDCGLKRVVNPERVSGYSMRVFLGGFFSSMFACVSKILSFINKLELWLLMIFHPWSDSYCVSQWLYWRDLKLLFWGFILFRKDTYSSLPTNSSSVNTQVGSSGVKTLSASSEVRDSSCLLQCIQKRNHKHTSGCYD